MCKARAYLKVVGSKDLGDPTDCLVIIPEKYHAEIYQFESADGTRLLLSRNIPTTASFCFWEELLHAENKLQENLKDWRHAMLQNMTVPLEHISPFPPMKGILWKILWTNTSSESAMLWMLWSSGIISDVLVDFSRWPEINWSQLPRWFEVSPGSFLPDVEIHVARRVWWKSMEILAWRESHGVSWHPGGCGSLSKK